MSDMWAYAFTIVGVVWAVAFSHGRTGGPSMSVCKCGHAFLIFHEQNKCHACVIEGSVCRGFEEQK